MTKKEKTKTNSSKTIEFLIAMMKWWWYHFHSTKWHGKKVKLNWPIKMNKSVCSGTVFKWEFHCCVCSLHTNSVSSTRNVLSLLLFVIQLNTDSPALVNAQPITLNEKKYFVIIYFLTSKTMRRRRHCHCHRHTNDEQLRNLSVQRTSTWYGNTALCHLFYSISFISSVASAVRLWFYS